MNKLLIVLLGLLALGCSNSPDKKQEISDTGTKKTTQLQRTQKVSSPIGKERLIGAWGTQGFDNAVFDIRKDSIYYLEHDKSYKYALKDDSIKIRYPDYTFSAKIYFVKDTLMMSSDESGVTKYWRFKN